jgi:putative phage-type endonuclease
MIPLVNIGEIDRRKYIGGSDAAPILGISPWRTPLDVYLDKIKPRTNTIENVDRMRAMNRGKRMEPYVLDLLSEESGMKVALRNQRYRDPEFDFIAAEIDAETADGINVEIKTVSPFKAKEWGEQQSDEIPLHYAAQAMHGMMVTGREVCVFGVLIGGDDFRIYRIDRDIETIAAMRAKEIAFWKRIQDRRPPDPVNTEDVLRLFGKDDGNSVEAPEEIASALGKLRDFKRQSDEFLVEARRLEEQIKIFMGSSSGLTYFGKTLCTWKAQKSNRFDVTTFREAHPEMAAQFQKTIESRVFRLK